MKITGYSDHMSVPVGGELTFRISSESPAYHARLVRLIHGDRNPDGPGFKVEPCASNIQGSYAGRVQPINVGSCAVVPDVGVPLTFTFICWAWPTLPLSGRQVLLSHRAAGLSLELDNEGCLRLLLGGEIAFQGEVGLRARCWYFICARIDEDGVATLICRPRDDWPGLITDRAKGAAQIGVPTADLLVFAAEVGPGGHTHHYNGKLENPCLFDRALSDLEIEQMLGETEPQRLPGCIGAWDFGQEQHGSRIVDVSSLERHGTLINMPTRAMTGHGWTGESSDFTRVPAQYSAIHFHEDDLDDAGWESDFVLRVPDDMRSGIYAIHLSSEIGEDHIPFFVTPTSGKPQARVAFIASTLTYLAYGNEAIANRPDIKELMRAAGIGAEAPYPQQLEDKYIVANRLLSCYDIHSDGSGVCYSSHLRPLLNLRPAYLMPLHGLSVRPGGAAHLLAADLYITDWLEAQGVEFDVITDHEIDAHGADLLGDYDVIITGSHPEYHTEQMFDAFTAYCRDGGRMMYLGGNGFFCVTSLTEQRHAIETRRGRSNRPWSSLPGEEFHSTTGEQGGSWKSRARPAQQLTGIGTTAVGFTSGAPYRRTDAGRDPRLAWVFSGVDGDEIGAFPNLIYGHGAAGWEIDRADPAWGTPDNTVILASARLEDDSYNQIVDELEAPGPHSAGSANPKVRADMTYLEYPKAGAVFSVGSCMWAGSLSYNGYDNNVSVLTGNVLREFLDRA